MYSKLHADDRGSLQECIVDAGDWLYVPEGWHHASWNLEDSIGIASQLGGVGSEAAVTPTQRLWAELWLLSGAAAASGATAAAGDEAVAASERLLAVAPANREAVYQRAVLLSAAQGGVGRRAEALQGFRDAIKASPRQAEPYNNWVSYLAEASDLS